MATATLPPPAVPASGTTDTRSWARPLAAFILGAVGAIALGGSLLLAYDAAWAGRVIPGVSVGTTDLSGLDRAGATAALRSAHRSDGDGWLVLRLPDTELSIAYAEVGRQPDVDGMLDEAMAVGRTGGIIERTIGEIRTLLGGVRLAPRVTLDARALDARVDMLLAGAETRPVDASIAMTPSGIATTSGRSGRSFDHDGVRTAARRALASAGAPAQVAVDVPAVDLPPAISDAAVLAARMRAERMTADLQVVDGPSAWTLGAATIRRWIILVPAGDGSIVADVDATAIPAALAGVAKAIERAPASATFLTGRDGSVVGVTASRDGRSLDVPATAAAVAGALADRASGTSVTRVPAAVRVVAPKLTTEAARKMAPLMVRLGTWKTYFPISERNYWGANIWLPAQYINGTVLAPGATFDWFRAVGPITRARGFGPGGYIDGDHTDPTGALGGGMCSSSTTLFNAALRAGLQMGARANHTYYIDRYPLGLDATVYAGQSVTFTNDTSYPILIRGYKIRDGAKGWVQYDIWGVPEGRTVSISKPVVRNVLKATTIVRQVTTLAPGVRRQVEYPVNGMDTWVTRDVRDRAGNLIHHEVWYSHYRLWNGIVEVGVRG